MIETPQLPLILGHPWLEEHNPQINWRLGKVSSWGLECASRCLLSNSVPPSPLALMFPAALSSSALELPGSTMDTPLVSPSPDSPSPEDCFSPDPCDLLTLEALKPLTPSCANSPGPMGSLTPIGVTVEYAELSEVFSKKNASILPPYRPYDCAIDLLPGSTPPRGRLFSLSGPETAAMKDYIDESLAAGFICPGRGRVFLCGEERWGA